MDSALALVASPRWLVARTSDRVVVTLSDIALLRQAGKERIAVVLRTGALIPETEKKQAAALTRLQARLARLERIEEAARKVCVPGVGAHAELAAALATTEEGAEE
jgi:hypothetical protein